MAKRYFDVLKRIYAAVGLWQLLASLGIGAVSNTLAIALIAPLRDNLSLLGQAVFAGGVFLLGIVTIRLIIPWLLSWVLGGRHGWEAAKASDVAALQAEVARLREKVDVMWSGLEAPSARLQVLTALCKNGRIQVHIRIVSNIYVGVVEGMCLTVSGRDLHPIELQQWDVDAENTRLVEFEQPGWLIPGTYQARLVATHPALTHLAASFSLDVG